MSSWQQDKKWADKYHPVIEQIVRKVADKIITFNIAPDQEDQTEATDYIITVEKGTIACRIRKQGCQYRDLTIRSWRKSGAKTELSKIKEGFGRWYIYAWAKNETELAEWWLLDLDAFRASPLINNTRHEKLNIDGKTAFVAYSSSELYLWNILIEKQINSGDDSIAV